MEQVPDGQLINLAKRRRNKNRKEYRKRKLEMQREGRKLREEGAKVNNLELVVQENVDTSELETSDVDGSGIEDGELSESDGSDLGAVLTLTTSPELSESEQQAQQNEQQRLNIEQQEKGTEQQENSDTNEPIDDVPLRIGGSALVKQHQVQSGPTDSSSSRAE